MKTRTLDILFYSCGCICCLGFTAVDVSPIFLTGCLVGAIMGLAYFMFRGDK